MDARAELSALYSRWRALTEQEGYAIRAAAWTEVAELQESKQQLQAGIHAAVERLNRAHAGPGDAEREFQPVVSELIQLEQRNAEWLAARRRDAESEKQRLDQSTRNLRQLHQSYGVGVNTGHWQSYS